MTKKFFRTGTLVAVLAFILTASGCTTLSTSGGVAVPNGFFDGDSRSPIASYKMWLPQMGYGLISTIGGAQKFSAGQIPDVCLFSSGRKEFIQKTNGKKYDVVVKWYLIFVEVIAYPSN
ncbi:MAG: hypothetical protein LBC72_00490 [Spirochaetaceae bacterium]|jgi:hypothetical protein|nr:hypothetical protein [Spirochaetaceae bacterium]